MTSVTGLRRMPVRRWSLPYRTPTFRPSWRSLCYTTQVDTSPLIYEDYAVIRDHYQAPKYPIVLAHGLLGFDELRPAASLLPPLQYWHGIVDELSRRGMHVITAAVEPAGSIERRAVELMHGIERQLHGQAEGDLGVNIIAGRLVRLGYDGIVGLFADAACPLQSGLDSRYMISRLQPEKFRVHSLTTLATPHRGSAVADWLLNAIPGHTQERVFAAMKDANYDSEGFRQLSRKYMIEKFNPNTPDVEGLRYFSYGASVVPRVWSVFRRPYHVLLQAEGPNDGLVSVESSKWGKYKGTLVNVDHLDTINWANRMRTFVEEVRGQRKFNAIAFYLDIAESLAKEGL